MISRELAGVSVKPIILSLLAKGESYGYALLQRIEDLSGGTLSWDDSTLYPVLHRLKRTGCFHPRGVGPKTAGGANNYRLTARGHEVLETEKRQWLRVKAVSAQLWGLQPRLA
jgi:DNA-binding PadR family transcriptional regulator